mgnify:CR=1 FL=1
MMKFKVEAECTPEEARALRVKRPLAEATLRRIAAKGTEEALAAPIADGPDWP